MPIPKRDEALFTIRLIPELLPNWLQVYATATLNISDTAGAREDSINLILAIVTLLAAGAAAGLEVGVCK